MTQRVVWGDVASKQLLHLFIMYKHTKQAWNIAVGSYFLRLGQRYFEALHVKIQTEVMSLRWSD